MRKRIVLMILLAVSCLFTGCGKEKEQSETPTYEQGGVEADDSYMIDKLVTAIDGSLQYSTSLRLVKYDEKIHKDNIIYRKFIDKEYSIVYTYDLNENVELYEKLYIRYFKNVDSNQWYSDQVEMNVTMPILSEFIPVISLQKNEVSYGGREIFNTVICNTLIVDNYKYYTDEVYDQLIGIEETTKDDKKIIWLINLDSQENIQLPNFDNRRPMSYENFINQ